MNPSFLTKEAKVHADKLDTIYDRFNALRDKGLTDAESDELVKLESRLGKVISELQDLHESRRLLKPGVLEGLVHHLSLIHI